MKRIIVSGYFNPLHGGHLDMIEAAEAMGDHVIVIVNNDAQQLLKKGKIILDQENRARLLNALQHVHEVVIAVDNDPTVIETLKQIRSMYPEDELVFANGGDRDGERVVPETEICEKLHIVMKFGVGSESVVKRDSSSRINQARGAEG